MSGIYVSLAAKVAGGYAQKNALDASAAQLSQEAGQSVASGIQGAIQDRRRAAYVASNARAAIAGGGLSTTGTSAIQTVGQIRGEGEYRALTSLYQGQDRASELDYRASSMRNAGSNAVTSGWISGISSVLSGGSSFFDKYGADTPSTLTSSRYSGGYTGGGSTDFVSG
jgi:hypothetical protein